VTQIFVVDDDESVRRAVDRLLRSAGYQVRSFASAVGVVSELDRNNPACLIVDVRMPGFDGLELLDILRAAQIAVPVIFITGHGDLAMAVRAMKAGAVDFLAKPFDDNALLAAVAEAVAQGQGHRVIAGAGPEPSGAP
jgi:FixJ family two-component response regulator